MKITTIGLDVAKNVLQIHGVDERGQVVVSKQLKCGKVMEYSPIWSHAWSEWKRAAVRTTGRGG